jgi:O-antigen ligase
VKWIFLLSLLIFTPALAIVLRSRPKFLILACFAIGLMPFVLIPFLYVAPISWAQWPGPVKGMEVSLLDGIAVAVILATPAMRTPTSIRVTFGVYWAALAISTLAAMQIWPSAFYGWQLLRAVVVYLAVARASQFVEGAPTSLLAGMGFGVVIEAVWATLQFATGAEHPGGNMGHQNILGMSSHFAVFPAFALVIGGRRHFFAVMIVAAGVVIAIVGGSRATIGLLVIGLIVTAILSFRHNVTARKATFALLAAAVVAVAAPFMMSAIDRRSEADRISSNDERTRLNQAARMIIADHLLGVGANQYVIVANLGGYSDRAGVAWNTDNRAAPVHNSYFLVTAELGLLGIVGIIAFFGAVIFQGLASLKRSMPDERADLLAGVIASIIILAAHSAFEWVTMTFTIHYLLAINVGIMVGVGARLRVHAETRSANVAGKPKPRLAPARETWRV